MEKPTIFVTGATGFIGQNCVSRLLDDYQAIIVLTRDLRKIPVNWKEKVSVLEGDLSDEGLTLPAGTRVVFHCAGETKDKSMFQETNVEGTRNIVKACLKHGKCRLVYLSSVGVTGADKDGSIDEAANCFPKNIYEKTKYEAEKIIQDAVKNSRLDAVILRPSIVYGPGIAKERDSFLALAQAIKKGRFCIFGKSPSYYNIVYVGDVVEALIYLANNDIKASGEVFIINDAILWRDFVREVFSALKMNNQVTEMPNYIGYIMALICEIGKKTGIRMPFSFSRYKALTCRTVFSAEKLKQSGFEFKYGNKQGIGMTLQHYISQGLL
jgi:2-alkyl-3-oxoalkanoate reductase